MAYTIDAASCTGCGACELECPNAAIRLNGDIYRIAADKCTECDGDAPRCAGVCPVDGTCVPA